MKTILLLIISLLTSASYAEEIIQSYRVSKKNLNLIKITDRFEVKSSTQSDLLIYVLKEEKKDFLKLAPNSKLISRDINYSLKGKSAFLSAYRSFEEVKIQLKEWELKYPKLTSLINYGESELKKPLLALKLTNKSSSHTYKKRLMLTSATHGDELITVEVLLNLMKDLLENHKTNKRFLKFLNNTEIYFIPVVNPDGFSKRSRYSGRFDPNRSYPMPNGSTRYNKTVSCIKNLMTFYNKTNIEGSIDFHASGKMVMFPWAMTKEKVVSSDFDFFDKLTTDMALENRYKHGQISKVIYVAKGSSADYYYNQNKGIAIAVELATSKVPRATKIPRITKDASEMTWKYLDAFSK